MNELDKQIAYLAAALKAPRIAEAAGRLASQARDAGWTHQDYLIAVLDREVAARTASGAQLRIRAAGFPARKTLEEFVFDHQPGVRRDDIAPLAVGGYLAQARNVVLLGPPAPAKPTSPPHSVSPPAMPDTGCCLPPPPTGWPGSKKPTNAADCPPN
jgi:DNA replication protein DnaC